MIKKFLFVLFLCFLSFGAAAQTDVIKEVFLVLNQENAPKITNKDIALKGLQSLSHVDKNLHVEQKDNAIILSYPQKKAFSFTMPEENDVAAWTSLCKNAIDKACQLSQRLETVDFELPDRFAAAVLENLDGYSHYFSVFSDETEDKPFKIKRPFASRVVDNILLIRVLTFKKDISQNVKDAVLECSKCKGIILDLRGNHGGFLNEAISIADMFLDEGIIAYTLSGENAVPEYFSAGKGDIALGKPLVILIDGNTASAAEVLAGALSEQNRAVLIGTKTFGKGTVQDVSKMDSDRAMAVTTSYFYTPSGLKIDKIGLTPQICVSTNQSCEKEDRFFKEEDIDRAVKYLKTGL